MINNLELGSKFNMVILYLHIKSRNILIKKHYKTKLCRLITKRKKILVILDI